MRRFLTFACLVLAVAVIAECRTVKNVPRRRQNTAASVVPVTSDSSPDIYIVSPVLRRFIRSTGDACEKKELCLLHASRNPLSAFELYFVSKDNARLWDHNSHSHADCEKMFPDCGESGSEESSSSRQKAASDKAKPAADRVANFRDEDYGNDEDDDVILDDY